MNQQITPLAHSSVVGGSTAARRLHCPRSIHLETLIPKVDSDNAYTREGTALHEMMAVILSEGVEDPRTLLPFTHIQKSEDGADLWSFTVDEDLWVDKGEPALTAFDAFVEQMEEAIGAPFDYLVEQKVAFPGIDEAFGTSDIVGRCGDEVFVVDWKFGRGAVEAEGNAQLMFYAIGALNTCAEFLNKDVDGPLAADRPVTCVIIQPVLSEQPFVWETDLGALDGMAARLREAVKAGLTQGPRAPIGKGKGCQYCAAKPVCPLYVQDTEAMVSKMAALRARQDAMVEDAVAGDTEAVKAGDAAIAALLADMLDLSEEVDGWAKSVAQLAHDLALDGVEIPGRKLVAKTGGVRSWAKDDDLVVRLMKQFKLPLDAYMPRSLVTMPTAEKLVKKNGFAIPDDFIKKPGVTGYKLVRETYPDAAAAPPVASPAMVGQLAAKLRNFTGETTE